MIIFFIVITALILRLINLNQSLWLDEAINIVYSQKYNFFNFITVYSLGDFHPPLHFAIIWVWTRIFGTSEITVRIPSVLFGVATVWLTYLTGKNLFSKKVGLVAAAILAFNPLHIYYSQEARMYSLAAFSAIFSFWALINLLKGKKLSLLFYLLSVVLILYSDYLAYLVLIGQFMYVVWFKKQKIIKVLSGMVLGGIFWLPWLLIFPSQLKTGLGAATQIPGWANVVGGANTQQLVLVWVKSIIGRVSFENKFVYLSVVSFISAIYGFILLKAIRPISKEVKLLLIWGIGPVVLAFIVSFYIPVLAYFRMIFILPCLALLLAKGISQFKPKYQKLLVGLILVSSFLFLLLYYFNPKYQREDWRGAVNFVLDHNFPFLLLFEDTNVPAPIEYYFVCKKSKNCNVNVPSLKNFPARNDEDVIDITALSPGEKIYLFDYLIEISDPKRLVQKKLESLGYKNTETYNFNGVGFVYEYSK